MALDHLAVMETGLGIGALVHRACLDAHGGAEMEAEIEADDVESFLDGCCLCGEPLTSAP